jgi:hypothetical protein
MSKRNGGDHRPNSRQRRAFRVRLYEGQDGLCAWCKAPLADWHEGDLDRIVPGKDGGTYKIANLVLACRSCNLEHGIAIRHGKDHARC